MDKRLKLSRYTETRLCVCSVFLSVRNLTQGIRVSKNPQLHSSITNEMSTWLFIATIEYKLGSPEEYSTCELSVCAQTKGKFIGGTRAIYKHDYVLEACTMIGIQKQITRMQTLGFPTRADLYTCKGKILQKQSYCNTSNENTENNNVRVCFNYSEHSLKGNKFNQKMG